MLLNILEVAENIQTKDTDQICLSTLTDVGAYRAALVFYEGSLCTKGFAAEAFEVPVFDLVEAFLGSFVFHKPIEVFVNFVAVWTYVSILLLILVL